MNGAFRARITLEERLEQLKTRRRDCRDCKMFEASPTGLGFGWCKAFTQYVKLYHPANGFYSQCQFKMISRAAPDAPDGSGPAGEGADPAP